MKKVKFGLAYSPNHKQVKSKVGSLVSASWSGKRKEVAAAWGEKEAKPSDLQQSGVASNSSDLVKKTKRKVRNTQW